MNWININMRVPDNRRRVLVAGFARRMGIRSKGREVHLSRFNPGDAFDIERPGRTFNFIVTHWAEIELPEDA